MTDLCLSDSPQVALRAIIERTILEHPRSQQAEIGASEIGTPCMRKLAFKLSGKPRVAPETPGWRPTVGTAVHSWVEAMLRAENERLGWNRWHVEETLTIGDYGAEKPLGGHCDVYDMLTDTVVDWKFPGITTIREARKARTPKPGYVTQAHCYGLGWAAAGFPVKHVAVYFLPAAGELGDGYYWTQPYNPQVAYEALNRAKGIIAAAESASWDLVVQAMPKADDYCAHCPWFSPGTPDERVGCPGAIETKPFVPSSGPAFGGVK